MPAPRAVTLVCICCAACVPEGNFLEISVGDGRACAIDESGEVACWGGSDAWTEAQAGGPPAGPLKGVSVGDSHACALRSDGTATCWGPAAEVVRVLSEELAGVTFQSISAGHNFTCGVRNDDGTLACWGINPVRDECALDPDPPPGACDGGALDPPPGEFSSVVLTDVFYNLCALQLDQRAVCWGIRTFPDVLELPPDGSFTSVGVGATHACGAGDDGAVVCWGPDGAEWTSPPEGEFRSLTAGYEHTCGLEPDGGAVCWGVGSAVEAAPPSHTLVAIDAGAYQTCGISEARGVSCWGFDNERKVAAAAPPY